MDKQISRIDVWAHRLEARRTPRTNLNEQLRELQVRLHSASESERAAIVHELVLKIEVKAEEDVDGNPTYHYQRRHRADGSFWFAQRVPHVIVHVVYGFPDPKAPANKKAGERAHAHGFMAASSFRGELESFWSGDSRVTVQ